MGASSEEIATTLQAPLARHGWVRLAVLFGSAARGSLRPGSDLDVGILPRDSEVALKDELRLQSELERACGRTVDLVRLDDADPLLRWHAARDGLLLLETEPFTWNRFRAAAARDYAELRPRLAWAQQRYRRHILGSDPAPGAGS